MKLVINTQFMENYGAHDWNGEGECPQYWKMKGGSTYVVEDLQESHIVKINMDGIPTLESLICHDDDYSREYILGWDIVEDDEEVFEEWEAKTFLTYQTDREQWVCREIYNLDTREVDLRISSWDMTPEKDRANYKCEYRSVKDGNWYTGEEIVAMRGAA